MSNRTNRTFPQSLACMAAAMMVSLFAFGATTTTGPTAITLAATPSA